MRTKRIVSVTVDTHTLEKAKRRAAGLGISLSALLEMTLRYTLKKGVEEIIYVREDKVL